MGRIARKKRGDAVGEIPTVPQTRGSGVGVAGLTTEVKVQDFLAMSRNK